MSLQPYAQSPRVGDPGRRWVAAWGVATAILAGVTVYSASSVTHGFIAYYAAARLLLEGQLGPMAYDDAWFGAYLQQLTGTNIREIFTPNPPTMALMALPIAVFDHRVARVVWLGASVALFAAAVFALARQREREGGVPIGALLLAMLAPAVFSNIRIGQGYLIVFALFAAALLWIERHRPFAGGAALGFALGLKLSGAPWLLILAVQRRWRALAAAIVTAVALVAAVTPFIDIAMWWQHPDVVRGFVERSSGSVTAYQTTLSLFRRMCVADPLWNPAPPASCQPIAFAIPYALIGIAALITAVVVYRARATPAALAAGVTLSLLAMPASAEVHFVLLGIPLLIVGLRPLELAVIGLLILVPLELTAERFTAGWWILLAYPRLYATWLLWAACARQVITSSLQPKGS
jgi:hypothetical protein